MLFLQQTVSNIKQYDELIKQNSITKKLYTRWNQIHILGKNNTVPQNKFNASVLTGTVAPIPDCANRPTRLSEASAQPCYQYQLGYY